MMASLQQQKFKKAACCKLGVWIQKVTVAYEGNLKRAPSWSYLKGVYSANELQGWPVARCKQEISVNMYDNWLL